MYLAYVGHGVDCLAAWKEADSSFDEIANAVDLSAKSKEVAIAQSHIA